MNSMVPIHNFKKNTAIICEITEPIRHECANNRYGDRYYVTHIRLPKGEDHKLIVGVMMRRALEASCDNQGYVGRWFHIHKYAPAKGKRYSDYAISEIVDPSVTAA
jgi:hypothetical protein